MRVYESAYDSARVTGKLFLKDGKNVSVAVFYKCWLHRRYPRHLVRGVFSRRAIRLPYSNIVLIPGEG